jgi:FixJ family two-component response regulator
MTDLEPAQNGQAVLEGNPTAPVVHIVDSDSTIKSTLVDVLLSVKCNVQLHTSAEVFLSEYDPSIAGCVVAELYLSGMSGLALQKHLTEHQMAVPLLILTAHADVPMVVEAMDNGAFDVMLKPPQDHTLVESVREAIRFDQAHRCEELRRREIVDRFNLLTERENEVLNSVLDGVSNKQIAVQMGISFRTVESHRANIKHKLNANSLAELFELAFWNRSVNDRPSRNS